MAKCHVCGAETQLHVDGRPVCVRCDKMREAKPPQSEDRSGQSLGPRKKTVG